MTAALYTIIIYPLYQIVEFAFRLFIEVFKSTGFAIIGVSITVSLLCLPLYAVAEHWEELERQIQKNLKPDILHIKKAFKGDEQYMLLSTLYKENHYHPIMALRSSFGLLIQIPFFIAAYNFMSHNDELIGRSFLFIKDMGMPDNMFQIGNFGINILPIAMTLINIIAGIIYSKGHPLREKVQIFGMALIFLVILYPSPSGLVFYWTMNNLFSLIKNIYFKLKNPLKSFYFTCCIAITIILTFLIVKQFKHITIFMLLALFIYAFPYILKLGKKIFSEPLKNVNYNKKHCNTIFFLSCFSLAFLCGILIPSLLELSSTAEYCYLDGYENPLFFLKNSFFQAVGLFVFWPTCVYFLFNKKVKAIISFIFFSIIICGIINTFLFQGNYGTILPEIIFTEHKTFFPSKTEFFLNISTLCFMLFAIYILFRKNLPKVITSISGIIFFSLVSISLFNVYRIGKFFKNYEKPNIQLSDLEPRLNLAKASTGKKNVLVLMIDRSTGYIIDPVFDAYPKLYEQFDGFKKFPNTLSFGSWTIQGAVCLYGGYEYTPWEMNKRKDIPMVDKHNEGISLQAKIFSENGYKVSEWDPPYPNYDKPPVFKAFESFENTNCYQLIGKYNSIWCKEHNITPPPIRSTLIKRNFIWFSLFKISPMIMRPVIHYEEFWGKPKGAGGADITHFIDNYSLLDFMPELTNLDNEQDCFFIMDNELCHDQVFTQYPNYEPAQEITDKGPGKWNSSKEFHVNQAAYRKLGEFFDFLRENDAYDNSRIIIVADHGALTKMPQFEESPNQYPLEKFNPVLMIKDFNSHGKMYNDMRFMTHADVPAMAMHGIIENPVNPYTGNEIKELSLEEKNEKAFVSMSDANAVNSTENNGYKIKKHDWYKVHDSIFKTENWEPVYP